MSIQQLDERDTTPYGVCVNVPVQIGGKLRREHCSVLDRKSDLLLLGLPWMRAYGVKIDPTTLTLSIPSQESKKDIVVQGYAHDKVMGQGVGVARPQVYMLQMAGPNAVVGCYDGVSSEGDMSQEGEERIQEVSERRELLVLSSETIMQALIHFTNAISASSCRSNQRVIAYLDTSMQDHIIQHQESHLFSEQWKSRRTFYTCNIIK